MAFSINFDEPDQADSFSIEGFGAMHSLRSFYPGSLSDGDLHLALLAAVHRQRSFFAPADATDSEPAALATLAALPATDNESRLASGRPLTLAQNFREAPVSARVVHTLPSSAAARAATAALVMLREHALARRIPLSAVAERDAFRAPSEAPLTNAATQAYVAAAPLPRALNPTEQTYAPAWARHRHLRGRLRPTLYGLAGRRKQRDEQRGEEEEVLRHRARAGSSWAGSDWRKGRLSR